MNGMIGLPFHRRVFVPVADIVWLIRLPIPYYAR